MKPDARPGRRSRVASDISRREFLRSTAYTATACVAAPTVLIRRRRKLRVLGTHVTLQETLRQRAEQDLGIELEFSTGGSARVLHRASTNPSSFDLYEQWSNSMRVLWQANAIQPLEVSRLRYWDEINDLTRTGRLTRSAKLGAGDAPNKLLFVQRDGTLGSDPTDRISFVPYVHNVDSFGYDARVVPKGEPYETESWAWLFDPQWKGRVAIVNAPTIGLFDVALAARSLGLARFRDIGNMTRDEIDRLFDLLVTLRKEGQFRGVWTSVPHSVELMETGQAVVESMFSPGVFALRGKGVPCVYASPREGYRAWHGVMCLSAAADSDTRDTAYAYMNWWLSGWPGAFIARQGYYISNPQRAREYMTQAEWDYWYEGLPAATDLVGTDGQCAVRAGELRDGGSYERRFSNIAVWNTVMPQYEYTLSRWSEFLSA